MLLLRRLSRPQSFLQAWHLHRRQHNQFPDKPQFGYLKDGKIKKKKIIIGTGSSTLADVAARENLAAKSFFKSLKTPVPIFGKLGGDIGNKDEKESGVIEERPIPSIARIGAPVFGDPKISRTVITSDTEWAERAGIDNDVVDFVEDACDNGSLIRKVPEMPLFATNDMIIDPELDLDSTRPPRDLFEELFPEEIASSQTVKEKPQQRTRRLEEFNWRMEPTARALFTNPTTDLTDTSAEQRAILARQYASILVLANASKSLSISDFLRLAPRGHHIEGWTSGLLKVIPGRDARTLLSTGVYYILFTSIAAARAYHDRVTRLHHLSRTYTSQGPLSSISPPAGYLRDGEDLHKLMSEFTLIPPSQRSVSLKLLTRPSSNNIEKLIANGGQTALVRRQAVCPNLVLIHISDGSDFGFVSEYEVRRWLVQDGKARGLAWGFIDGMDEIVRLDGRLDEDDEDEEGDISGIEGRQRVPNRFVLSFKEEQEARRFVREWHKRGVTFGRGRGQGLMTIDAELLW